jgi:hypothetical protein
LRMLASGCLLLPTEVLEKPLIDSSSMTHTFLHNFLCAYTRRGSPHLFLIIHYLQFHPLFYLGFNFFVMKSCQTFFHSWLFGSMFVFILSLDHRFVHFCYFFKLFFFLKFNFLKIFNSKLWLITSSPWTGSRKEMFFPL